MNSLLNDIQELLFAEKSGVAFCARTDKVELPTFQRIFSRAVQHFQVHRSLGKLVLHGFAKGGLSYLRDALTAPSPSHLTGLRRDAAVPIRVILFNVGGLLSLIPFTSDRDSVTFVVTSIYIAVTAVFFASLVLQDTLNLDRDEAMSVLRDANRWLIAGALAEAKARAKKK